MITYPEALTIALKRKPNTDHCTEYKSAYVFTPKEDQYYIGGYGHTPCVILKDTGNIITMMEFGITGDSEPVAEYEVK